MQLDTGLSRNASWDPVSHICCTSSHLDSTQVYSQLRLDALIPGLGAHLAASPAVLTPLPM